MIRSTPNSRARIAASKLEIPQSTVTSTLRAACSRLLHGTDIQAVAVFEPIRLPHITGKTKIPEHPREQRRARRSVHVVIPKNPNLLATLTSLSQTLRRHFHVADAKRVRQSLELGGQESLDRGGGMQAPLRTDLKRQRRKTRLCLKRPKLGFQIIAGGCGCFRSQLPESGILVFGPRLRHPSVPREP